MFQTFIHLLKIYTWPRVSWSLTTNLITYLLKQFDDHRLKFMLLVVPIYFVASTIAIFLLGWILNFLDLTTWSSILLLIPVILFIAFPLIATWHLTFFLFAKGYFEFFKVDKSLLSRPIMGLVNGFIEMFR